MAELLPRVGFPSTEAVEEHARLARFISNVLSPPVVAAPVVALGVWLSDTADAWRYALLYVSIGVVVPLADLIILLRSGRVSDFHISDRRERRRPFAISILSTSLALLLLAHLGAPTMLVVLIWAGLLQALLLFLVTLVWQISIHSAAIASLATLSVVALGSCASGLVLLVPVVGWSRVHLGRHTVAQVVAGAALGATSLLYAVHGVLW